MQRRSASLRLWAGAVVGLSLLAAACGSSDSDSGDGATGVTGVTGVTVDKGVQDALNSTTVPGTATTVAKVEPKTMEEWEKLWETERAAVVKRITDNKWGLSADGKTITGPEGFTVDMTKCAAGWSNTEGITDTTFKVGQSLAQSGTLADYGNFVTEIIEPTAPTITDPMTTLASKNCTVFIAMTAGTSCTQAVVETAQNGMKEKVKYLFQPLTCAGTSFIAKDKIGGDGSAANGWHMFNPGIKDIKDPSINSDPWMVFIKDLLTKKGIDPQSSSSLGNGMGYAWPYVQTLLIAQALPGGLTRANLVVAHRAISMTPPTHLWGIKEEMNGNKNAYLIEGGQFAVFDSGKQIWVLERNLIDLNGKSSLCA